MLEELIGKAQYIESIQPMLQECQNKPELYVHSEASSTESSETHSDCTKYVILII